MIQKVLHCRGPALPGSLRSRRWPKDTFESDTGFGHIWIHFRHSVICTVISHGDATSRVFKSILKSRGSMESHDRVSIDHIEFIPHHKRCTHSPDPVVESSTTRSMTVGTFQTRNPHQTISGIVIHKPQDLAKLRKSGSCATFGLL